MKEFDRQTLAAFNGQQDGGQSYVAKDGKVYDVSASKLWKNGMHMKRHQAGNDLSDAFAAAPHGEEVFERVRPVGVLITADKAAMRPLPPWLEIILAKFPVMARHPHPMLVHYPIVFMFSVSVFTLLALTTGNMSFATTALHCLVASLLFTPLAIASGLFTWWLNYLAKPMRAVRIKIWGSSILMMAASGAFIWQLMMPDILTKSGPERLAYLCLVCALLPLVSVIGWFGAQLTFPVDKR